jgi:hypothetical protein
MLASLRAMPGPIRVFPPTPSSSSPGSGCRSGSSSISDLGAGELPGIVVMVLLA